MTKPGFEEKRIKQFKDIVSKDKVSGFEKTAKRDKAIEEIENAMERWHLGRDEDEETLQNINDILVGIGLLGWHNKSKGVTEGVNEGVSEGVKLSQKDTKFVTK
jgi:hypothetical protein